MRLIGIIEDSQKARHFASWLLTQDIEIRVDTNGDQKSELWVKEEDHFKTALAQYEEFQQNPDAPKYAAAVEAANRLLREQEKKRRQFQKQQIKVRPPVGRAGHALGPVTKTVMLLCLLVAILTNFGQRSERDQGANRALQFVAVDQPDSLELATLHETNPDALSLRLASITRGELWRLVTPIFIHFGIWHFLFNMLWFLQFGRMIESRYGAVWMAILIVSVAVVSNIGQAVAPIDMGGSAPVYSSGILISRFGGLSGVVFGMFGFIFAKQYIDPKSGFFLPQLTSVLLIAYLFFCMLPAAKEMTGTSVANWCHGVGFLSGILLAYVKR